MDNKCCWFCAHWFQGLHLPGNNASFGECRRYPPVVGSDLERWPVTAEDNFCGEFRELPGIVPRSSLPQLMQVFREPWVHSTWTRAAITILSHVSEDLRRGLCVSVDILASSAPDGMSAQERNRGIGDVCRFARNRGIHIEGDPVPACRGPLANDNP
jgi:hypothetical protein